MDIEEKFRKIEFLNLLCSKSGSFRIDPQSGNMAYFAGGATFPVPYEYIEELFAITMESAKLTQLRKELEHRRDELDAKHLDGAIIRKYDVEAEETP